MKTNRATLKEKYKMLQKEHKQTEYENIELRRCLAAIGNMADGRVPIITERVNLILDTTFTPPKGFRSRQLYKQAAECV